MARKTCPNQTITVQLDNKHVLRGKERPRYLSARSPKTTPYKVHFLSLTWHEATILTSVAENLNSEPSKWPRPESNPAPLDFESKRSLLGQEVEDSGLNKTFTFSEILG